MKVILVLAALAAVVVARPQEQAREIIPILDHQLVRDDLGQYALSYHGGDGTKVTEQGALVPNDAGDGHVLVKQGTLSYYAPDGSHIEESWTADTSGFHPVGDHLPTPPPIPETA